MIEKSSAPGSKPSQTHSGRADPGGVSFSNSILGHISPTVTAVLVDVAFFLKRARLIFGRLTPQEAAQRLHRVALDHLNGARNQRVARLHRIFVYDAPPVAWKGHRPISKTPVDLLQSPTARWRSDFHRALIGQRKVALRLGEVPAAHIHWQLKQEALKALANGRRSWESITDDDFQLELRQEGVDMRLGLDIASLAYQGHVNQIVLISGDADFVPAAKLARRQGIDFVLDPMWANIRPDLYEHIDGLRTVVPRPGGSGANGDG